MSRDNEYLDKDFEKRVKETLPPDHPMNEKSLLTPLESFAYPVLLWFFDLDRARGSGRSYLMARVCIELAMRGNKIHLNDYHVLPRNGERIQIKQHFLRNINDLLNTNFKNELFNIDYANMTLEYKGRRPN